MATTLRIPSPLSREAPPIYAPGVFEGDIVTVPSHGAVTIVEIKPSLQPIGGAITFGHLTTSSSHEGSQLAEYFEKYVSRSIESLADPYAAAPGADPFEYRSVPYRGGRMIKAKLKWVGSIPPSPIDDD
jgi:hypothetical protein